MILEKMKSIIGKSPRIVRSVSASFGEYNATWEIGTETDPKEAEESGSKEPISRIAFIQMCGENQFEVVLHDKEGNWFLCTKNDVSGASSVSIEYFKGEREYEDCLLGVFPTGYALNQLGLEVIGLGETTKTVKPHEYNSLKNVGLFAVAYTANDGWDYPLEGFFGAPGTEEEACETADRLNRFGPNSGPSSYKVVQLPYQPGRGMEDVDPQKSVRVLDKSEEFNSLKNHGLFAIVRTANDGRDYPLESFECNPMDEETAISHANVFNEACGHLRQDFFWKVVTLPYRLGRGMEDAV